MTVLSCHTIEELCADEHQIITPFSKSKKFKWFGKDLSYGISHCGYDIRISNNFEQLVLRPPSFEEKSPCNAFTLAHTLEYFKIPKDIVGVVHDKSTLARLGIAVQNTIIEPGWCGYLTLEITSHRQKNVLQSGMPIAQVLFHKIDKEVEGYKGKYQDQENRPVDAR